MSVGFSYLFSWLWVSYPYHYHYYVTQLWNHSQILSGQIFSILWQASIWLTMKFFCNLLKWPLNLQSELRQCKMLTFMVLLGTILSREKRYSVICVFCVTWPRCVGSLSVRAGWPAHWWLERAESLSYRCSVLVTTSPCNASVTQGHVTFMTYWQMVTL